MKQHREIITTLQKIPSMIKEFDKLEKSIANTDTRKKQISKENYQLEILNFEATNAPDNALIRKITATGNHLELSKPDFKPAYHSLNEVQRVINVIGLDKAPSRIKQQLELMELLEVKSLFQTATDFLDDTKVKILEKYLKGKK